jgi:hypothetical protein
VLAGPRSFSQLAASFLAVESQGILPCALACFTLLLFDEDNAVALPSLIFSQYVKELCFPRSPEGPYRETGTNQPPVDGNHLNNFLLITCYSSLGGE